MKSNSNFMQIITPFMLVLIIQILVAGVIDKYGVAVDVMTIVQYSVYIVLFGIWYYRYVFNKDKSHPIKKLAWQLPFIMVGGYATQVVTVAALNLARKIFPEAFSNYDKLMDGMLNTSWLMLVAVFVLAPIGEEIIFRGLILSYSRKCMKEIYAILLNGLLFGVYHGNLIQGIYACLFGMLLAHLAYANESIVPGILLHMAINVSAMFTCDGMFSDTTRCILCVIIGGAIVTGAVLIINKKDRTAL